MEKDGSLLKNFYKVDVVVYFPERLRLLHQCGVVPLILLFFPLTHLKEWGYLLLRLHLFRERGCKSRMKLCISFIFSFQDLHR